jgi:hypothetical protein
MKTFSILSAVCLVILGSTWATAQTNRGNPRDGQAIYEKNVCDAMETNWTVTGRMASI